MAGGMKAATISMILGTLVWFTLVPSVVHGQASGLSVNFYATTCPTLPIIVQNVLSGFLDSDPSLAPALLRMHFHDCFVRGCDASVLIISPTNNAERDGLPNVNSLRGFEVIDSIKEHVEDVCPNKVSCADIIALAALHSVIALGGPSWNLPLGRRDGNISIDTEANNNLPPPFFNFDQLVLSFAAKGLTEKQMVVLSGAHTIGSASCGIIQDRLYNFNGTNAPDPLIGANYLNFLRTKCIRNDTVTRQAMKFIPITSPFVFPINKTFDNGYYIQLLQGGGFFSSDAALTQNSTGLAIVQSEAINKFKFFNDFASAMIAMGKIEVKTGTNGAIHRVCSSATGN